MYLYIGNTFRYYSIQSKSLIRQASTYELNGLVIIILPNHISSTVAPDCLFFIYQFFDILDAII